MQHILIAVFEDRSDAERAQAELLSSGFSKQEARISRADATGQTDSVTGSPAEASADSGHDEGVIGSVRHFFHDLFGTDTGTHAEKYTEALGRGHHVLTVTAADEPEVERAADIVEKYGPVDIDEKAAEWSGAPGAGAESMRMSGAGGMQSDLSRSPDTSYQTQSLNDDTASGGGNLTPGGGGSGFLQTPQSGSLQRGTSTESLTGSARATALQGAAGAASRTAIPVVEERLKVGKREVQKGGVRVYSRLVETPVSESVGLREEHVNVERHKVDQPIGTDSNAFNEQKIELRETNEEAVVEKSARVVEEVVVGKQVSERQQQIQDTLRHTEVQVEQLGAQDEDYFRRHWQSTFGASGGRYEDYAPAYGFGAEMAGDTRYRGRSWDQVETDLKSGWDTRYGGSGESTWERFKAAIRHGWERIT